MRSKLGIMAMVGIAAISLTACSSGGGGGEGGTEETVFKVAFNQNIDHPQAQALLEMSDQLSEQTDGRYRLELFTDETLGDQASTIEQVQSGTIAFSVVAGSLLENFETDFSVVNLPYLYTSPEQQMGVLNDEDIMGDLYDSLEDDSIQVVTAYHGGVRNLYTRDAPVTEPADLDGLKIRVIGSETNVQMMSLMGGVGTPMAQGEVYTAIQSGVLDGAENNQLIYSSLSHDEIAPYYSLTNHLMMPDYLIVNPTIWGEISADDQAIFEQLFAESAELELELFSAAVEEAIAASEETGAKVNDVDLDAFRDAVLPLHEEFVTTDRQQAVYDAIMAAA